jgi:hypothetical protein
MSLKGTKTEQSLKDAFADLVVSHIKKIVDA